MSLEHKHQWYLGNDIIRFDTLPDGSKIPIASIFIECLDCPLIYRDHQIEVIWDQLFKDELIEVK